MSPRTPGTKPYEIVERALELSRADGCVVIADETSTANLRWAGNALTTNGVTRGRTLTVVATVDGKEGTASGVMSRSAVTADDLESLVRAAEEAAAKAGPAEDAQPLVGDVAHSPTSRTPPPRPRPPSSRTSRRRSARRSPGPGRAAGSCTGSPTTS